MPRIQLMVSLMILVAIIIIGLAIFVFTHLSGLNLVQTIILISFGAIGLTLIAGILIAFLRGIRSQK
jgi:hypothetical protein